MASIQFYLQNVVASIQFYLQNVVSSIQYYLQIVVASIQYYLQNVMARIRFYLNLFTSTHHSSKFKILPKGENTELHWFANHVRCPLQDHVNPTRQVMECSRIFITKISYNKIVVFNPVVWWKTQIVIAFMKKTNSYQHSSKALWLNRIFTFLTYWPGHCITKLTSM